MSIRNVVLFKHGVGYFERVFQLSGDATIDLRFHEAEMNDVLKSLTVLDLGSGRISSIGYESTRPLDKQLEDLAIRIPDENALTGLLAQLKGARIAVTTSAGTVEGSITGIEDVEQAAGEGSVTRRHLTLLTGGASLQVFDLLEIRDLTFLDDGLKKDLHRLLEILIAGKKKDLKGLAIHARGEGDREILVSYILETPVWKTSYRMLLASDDDRDPLIQGWAMVDNTQREDWEDVRLTLVAGLPVSFVHDLYSPRYQTRPVVEVPSEELYAPPVLEAAFVKVASAGDADDSGVVAAGRDTMRRLGRKADMLGRERGRSMPVQAKATEVGDLFQYEITNPVTVRQNEAALVPILHQGFKGRRVAVFNEEVRAVNPLSAVLFENTTGMTLEGGPVTVLEDANYVGESMLETLQPGETRLVPFAVELGCRVRKDHRSDVRDVHRLRIRRGSLETTRYRIRTTAYEIANSGDDAVDLFLEHRFVHGWSLMETADPAETTENFYRFRLQIPASSKVKFDVHEKGEEVHTIALREVPGDEIPSWAARGLIDAATLATFREIQKLHTDSSRIAREITETEARVSALFEDQQRLRDNLQALGSTKDESRLRERYVAEMEREEDALAGHRRAIDEARQRKVEVDVRLETLISTLDVETTLT